MPEELDLLGLFHSQLLVLIEPSNPRRPLPAQGIPQEENPEAYALLNRRLNVAGGGHGEDLLAVASDLERPAASPSDNLARSELDAGLGRNPNGEDPGLAVAQLLIGEVAFAEKPLGLIGLDLVGRLPRT